MAACRFSRGRFDLFIEGLDRRGKGQPLTLRHFWKEGKIEDLLEPVHRTAKILVRAGSLQPLQQQVGVFMGRQIQRCIDGIDPTPVGMGIGGPVDPDFSKDGQIGRTFCLRPLIGQGLSLF